jgi:tetratricopeptide (TPR) repeat protein
MGLLSNLLSGILRPSELTGRAGDDSKVKGPARLEAALAAFGGKDYHGVVSACEKILAREARNVQALHLYARAQIELGDRAAARSNLELAVKHAPKFAEAHFDLALILAREDMYSEAVAACRNAIAVESANLKYRLTLTGILGAAGRDADAYSELKAAKKLAPERTDLFADVCSVLEPMGKFPELLKFAERAVSENANDFDALRYLAMARYGVEDEVGAVEACKRAIALRSDHATTYLTLGTALNALGRTEEALAAYRRALKLSPGNTSIQFSIGLIDLLRGRYRDGWEKFDLRYLSSSMGPMRPCEPRWNGATLRGRSILVMREQGMGDEIMYSSCIPDLIKQASKVGVECNTRLTRLFSRSFPEATFFPIENLHGIEQTDAGFPVDVRSYVGSLPRYFRNTVRDFPKHDGYLRADSGRVQYWRTRLSALGDGMKIGISWRGGTSRTRRVRRSLTLQTLSPLLRVQGACWINLQYGERAAEIASLRASDGIAVTDWPEAIDGDYDETAALVSALDLVISVTTTLVHLTGALGKPAWVMVAHAPEWRYGMQGDTMPWYPSVKLFRQPEPQTWETVVGTIVERLRNELTARRR